MKKDKRKYIEVQDDDDQSPTKMQRRDSGIAEKKQEEDCVITVYTDGSARKKTEGSECYCVGRAGYGVYFPPYQLSDKSFSKETSFWGRVAGKEQTSRRAELTAIIRAIQLCPDKNAQLHIFTDYSGTLEIRSKYRKWSQKKSRADMDLLTELRREMYLRKHIPTITFVKGHSGNHGNNEADSCARQGTLIKCEKDGVRTTLREVGGKITRMVEVLEAL
ncbi:ribonuclease H-like protein [Meira miltonrushii]|uniref:ribonuclease H n=1 Tax=Meira miltonrushii TaxID=1280837 RepID=A0A316V7A4_9BASI|nr:ribonuclease H-like protein [Meira miltonrushii]PWN33074.1 ribonuclease H-like protein [Meira miltonrushii]